MPAEPTTTGLILTLAGFLVAASVLFSRASGKMGVPVMMIFLGIGVIAGEDGLGGIAFDDFGFTYRLGTVALVLILFDGGINTSVAQVRAVAKPSLLLATVGVAATALLTALGARLLGLGWEKAAVVGAVVSSTDAAAVFALLRSSGVHLKKKVASTLELESGINDPMAVILTFATTGALASDAPLSWMVLVEVLLQLLIGVAFGIAIGLVGRSLLKRLRVSAAGLYPVLTIALAFLAYGLPTLFWGSGILAVYVSALVLGNGPMPYRTGLLRVHDALAWLSQVAMFLLMGLLVKPHDLLGIAPVGMGIGLILVLVARPLVVFPSLLPFGYTVKESIYIAALGLRGAVPIILATYPVLVGVAGAGQLFNLMFFVVVLGALLPGMAASPLARLLGLEAKVPPAPSAVIEITSTQLLDGDVLSFYIDPASAVAGSRIADLPFPEGATVMLVMRDRELVPAKGRTKLLPGDHVTVFCRPEDRPFVQLIFGRGEE